MKKTVLSIVLILSIFLTFAGCGKIEPTVFTFDGVDVSLKEYNFFYKQLVLQAEQSMDPEKLDEYWNEKVDGKTNYEIVKEKAYEELMNLYVAGKKAEKSGFTYDNNVLQMAATIKNQFTGGNLQGFYDLVDMDAVSLDRITRLYAIRESLCQLLIDDGVIDLSEESLKKNFEEKYYKAQHILISTVDDARNPLPEDQIATKKVKADEALKRVQAGEDFTKLANELSEDPGQEQSPEGYVFTDGEMVKEFEETVKSLEVGNISGIVETSYGYHIIKRVPLSYEADSAQVGDIEQVITSALITDYLNHYVDEWKAEFNIVENKSVIDNLKI